jgi:lysozyme
MDASERCIELIHGSEGFFTKLPDGRYKSYLDKLPKTPVWTIYCGLTKGVKADTVWTVEQCEKAFSKEMSFYEDAIERMVTVPLNQNQFDALVSLVYNIGPGDPNAKRKEDKKGFYWSTLRKLLNQGKYAEAAAQFSRYKHSGGKVYKGLITRRAKEAALFMEPMPHEVEEPAEPLPQSVDAPPVPTTAAVIKQSTSAQISLLGTLLTGIVGFIQWLFGFTQAVSTEVVANQQSVSGFSALWSFLGINSATVVIAILLLTILGVFIRSIVRGKAS